jgi:hypothetical protein
VRHLAILLAAVSLSSCVGTKPAYEEPPLARDIYQKVTVSNYSGAASSSGESGLAARGSRYRSGSISSAAADWSRWPVGTVFRVLATGEMYEVDDFADDVVGKNTILLYKPSAPGSGSHLVTIEIITWGSPHDSAVLLQSQRSSTAKKILAELLARYPQRR